MAGYRRYIRDKENVVIPRSTLRRWLKNGELRLTDIHDSEFINEETNEDEMECDDASSSPQPPSYPDENSEGTQHDSDSDIEFDDFRGAANEKEEPKWVQTTLYAGSNMTIGQTVELVLSFFLRNAITKRCLDALLELLSVLLPAPNNLPRTRHQLYKLLKSLNNGCRFVPFKKHRFCEQCTHYLGEWSDNDMACPSCSGTKTNAFFVENSLRPLLTHAFEIRNLHKIMDEHAVTANDDPDLISDISCGAEFKRLKEEVIPEKYDICLIWNTDGIPVAASSVAQLWPIQVQIANIPPKNRRNFQFVCGLYYGMTKPNMLSFLLPFVATIRDLYSNGINWYHPENNSSMYSSVIAPIATLDCPARAAVQNIKQFNGKYGCSYCEHPGSIYRTGRGFKRVYPVLEITPPARTHDGVIQQAVQAINSQDTDVKGVKGPSVATLIPHFNVVSGFVPDYMHAILLGVERMLIDCWFGQGNRHQPYSISKTSERLIDESLLNIRPPDCVTRIPREIKFVKFWKAKELSAFLLFYSPILLKGKLAEPYYQHYILLVRATQILLQSQIKSDEILLAECMLKIFCSDMEKMYGIDKCSFNIHQLLHLCHSVRLWGPLWAWSAFPFEDGNGGLIRIKHGPNKIDVELLNTLQLMNIMYNLRDCLSRYSESEGEIDKNHNQSCQFPRANAIEALSKIGRFSRDELLTTAIMFYSKIKLDNRMLTSVSYERGAKRDNTCVTWNNNQFFGVVQGYAKVNGEYYAIVKQLTRSSDETLIRHDSTGITLSHVIPVSEGSITEAISVSQISGQLLRVSDYVCMFPNNYEVK